MVLFTGDFFSSFLISAGRAQRDEFPTHSPSRRIHNAFQFPSSRKMRRLKRKKICNQWKTSVDDSLLQLFSCFQILNRPLPTVDDDDGIISWMEKSLGDNWIKTHIQLISPPHFPSSSAFISLYTRPCVLIVTLLHHNGI
jgi:hypothetical protein